MAACPGFGARSDDCRTHSSWGCMYLNRAQSQCDAARRRRVQQVACSGLMGTFTPCYVSQPPARSTRGSKAQNCEMLILLPGEYLGVFTTLPPV